MVDWKTILALALPFAIVQPASAITWQANFPTNGIKGFAHVQCGGQGTTCPCTAGHYDCGSPPSFTEGACSTVNTSEPSGARFQFVPDPAGSGETVEQINLQEHDYWTDCGGVVTTRNELVYSEDANDGTPSLYGEGSDRYFAWSIYLPTASFSTWSCDPAESHTGADCAADSNGSYNPWNVVTQWHAGNNGLVEESFSLRRVGTTHTYRMLMHVSPADVEIWNDGGNKTTAISTNVWYDFVVHMHFSTSATTGFVEIWSAKNGAGLVKQSLNTSVCGGTDPTVCMIQTLDPADAIPDRAAGNGNYFKQGLYRNWSLSNNVNVYYKNTRTGATLAEVTSDFAVSANPASVSSTTTTSTSTTVTLQSSNFSGTVTLAASVSPSGPSATLGSTSLALTANGSASTSLTLAPATAPAGQYTVTVTATSGTLSHTTSIPYTITSGATNPAVSTLVDAFGGTAVNTSLWTVSATAGTISEGGGTLNLAPNANTGSSQLAVASVGTYTLNASAAFVKAPMVVSGGGNVDEDLALLLDGSNMLEWLYQGGQLTAFATVAGTRTTVATFTYSPTTHAWWRIRQASTSVFWDTSSDGTTWVQQGTLPTSSLFDLGSLKVYLHAETFGTGSPSPGVAEFASFNTPPSSSSNPWADSFAGTSIDTAKWTVNTNLGAATEGSGSVSLSPNANTTTAQVQLVSKGTASLVGNTASVKAVAVLNATNDVDEDFSLLNGGRNNKLTWMYEHGNLTARYSINATDTVLATLTYSASTHVYWRIREASGTVFWDTSADGVNWTNRASIAETSLFSLTTLNGEIYAETWSTNTASPGSAKFANMQ